MDLFEVAVLSLFPVHHIVEDGDHYISDFILRYKRHTQKWANHSWYEVDLILTCSQTKQIVIIRFFFFLFLWWICIVKACKSMFM